ncbi:MAG: TonB-dependent receptor plug domain-containing protein [Bacteroidota bacterium]
MVRLWTVLILVLLTCSLKGQTAVISGQVRDEQQYPLPEVNISTGKSGTVTDTNGRYVLRIVSDRSTTITFSHLGHQDVVLEGIILTSNETFEFNPIMKVGAVQMAAVEVSPTGQRNISGITTLSPDVVRKMPGANAGVANILKLLPGVSFNNELSTQYNVRGGNFDENLVYVNGIAVYRPFLVRSGQQEGLSFVNSDMVERITFSAGGFQAKYGDRLSSVLDVTYKIPTTFSVKAEASLLGAAALLETVSKEKGFTTITGLRYRDNAIFVNSQQTNTNVTPAFFDAQSYWTYYLSPKLRLSFLGNYAVNNYRNQPTTRQTNFGTLQDPRTLLVFYEGEEQNRYESLSGAIKADLLWKEDLKMEATAAIYHATEEEYSDVIAQYELGTVETDLGSEDLGMATNTKGVGGQFTRSRNALDALIINVFHKGILQKDNASIAWGLRYTQEDIRDRLNESEFLDSAGFFIRPPNPDFINSQPEAPFEAPLVAFNAVNAINFVKTNRFSGFLQFDKQSIWARHSVFYNIGVRAQHWSLTGVGINRNAQTLFSPRAQFAIKPNWKRDLLFRLAVGSYQQPPFYRELRDRRGQVNPDVKAQKSIHVVLGNEFSFSLFNRPFKLVGEAYYKHMTDVNSFTLEDVRLRYRADNLTNAYAYGFDVRLNGTFVPGAESWISLGYLESKENIENRGYIPRPTDQRLKFALLFQDYMPKIPNVKLYVNLVYNTGVPGGSPSDADPYEFQNRLRDYRRADLGISYIFADVNQRFPKGHWLHPFKALDVGLEIFNVFNNQNSITNTWVRDADTQNQFAVPNFMTTRLLNLKINLRL